MKPKVYFAPVNSSSASEMGEKAKDLLKALIEETEATLQKELPIKIHPGAVGNQTYLTWDHYQATIDYLKSINSEPYFIETCMANQTSEGKEKEFTAHGLDKIPFVIADGKEGNEHTPVPNTKGKHFPACLIAKKLSESKQVLVVTHFKGHGMAGFGGAIKMLGIGFASGIGKANVHGTKSTVDENANVEWDKALKSHHKDANHILDWNSEVVSEGTTFRERFAEYATAAVKDKNNLYITFAINFTTDCDCNGEPMEIVYPDLGVFASTDPVAIDKAVIDMLTEREGKTPFAGGEIFEYAENLGLGSTGYDLVEI